MVPMSTGGRMIGVLTVGNDPGGRSFDDDDLGLASEVAWRAATAAEAARLASERGEVARILQEGLKPPALPHMPGWESAAVYLPAGEVNAVGGDFYDAFEVEDGWMVTVGDVVGRGAAAASLTALARHTIRTTGLLTGDPRRALQLLDAELRARGEAALCTVAIMILPRTATHSADVTFVSAGHPLPLLLRDGAVEEVGTPGPLLGAFEGAEWRPETLRLEAGDQLVLFTDGVIEARGREDRFGDERLRDELAGAEGPTAAIRRVTRCAPGLHRRASRTTMWRSWWFSATGGAGLRPQGRVNVPVQHPLPEWTAVMTGSREPQCSLQHSYLQSPCVCLRGPRAWP